MKKTVYALLALAMATGAQAAQPSPEGVWLAGEGRSQIQISGCGDALCGKIVWLMKPNDDNGNPLVDRNNPERNLRTAPILGLTILSGLRPSRKEPGQWDGQVYNPEDGDTYNVYLRPKGSKLEVEGCLLIFCKTQVWAKVE